MKAQLALFGAEIGAGPTTAVDHSARSSSLSRFRQPLPSAFGYALNTDRIPGQARIGPHAYGQYNRAPADATAFVHRSDEFLLEYTATSNPAQTAATPRAASQWLNQIRELLNGYGTGRAYQNFPDPELQEPLRAYYGQNLPRLREIKQYYDLRQLFPSSAVNTSGS